MVSFFRGLGVEVVEKGENDILKTLFIPFYSTPGTVCMIGMIKLHSYQLL